MNEEQARQLAIEYLEKQDSTAPGDIAPMLDDVRAARAAAEDRHRKADAMATEARLADGQAQGLFIALCRYIKRRGTTDCVSTET